VVRCGVRFRVSTWNCFGQSQGVGAVTGRRAPARGRFADDQVAAECAAADVLCVQELLSRDAQRFFDAVGGARFESRFRDHNHVHLRSRTVRGSGLGMCARGAMARPQVIHFRDLGVSWDRLARKGTLHARLTLGGELDLDVLTTHLQAGQDARARRVRATQLEDLARHVAAVGSPDRPFVVCGDLNIDGLAPLRDGAEYRLLCGSLPGFEDLGAAGDLPTLHPLPDGNTLAQRYSPGSRAQRVDYLFWRPARGGAPVRPAGVERFLDHPLAGQTRAGGTTWASDHYGLTATFDA
jgi:endonuclease/exonuclease/phosphatase family metal-dependent hydrolase